MIINSKKRNFITHFPICHCCYSIGIQLIATVKDLLHVNYFILSHEFHLSISSCSTHCSRLFMAMRKIIIAKVNQ